MDNKIKDGCIHWPSSRVLITVKPVIFSLHKSFLIVNDLKIHMGFNTYVTTYYFKNCLPKEFFLINVFMRNIFEKLIAREHNLSNFYINENISWKHFPPYT